MAEWPEWSWELRFWDHLERRMVLRGFNETDLRQMLEDATGYRRDDDPMRWVIETRHEGARWEVIVEPQRDTKILDVVTAYEVY
jgi:hypothetical protein